MAEKKIDPKAQYAVGLALRVQVAGFWHYPGEKLTLRGDILQQLQKDSPEAIAHVTPV